MPYHWTGDFLCSLFYNLLTLLEMTQSGMSWKRRIASSSGHIIWADNRVGDSPLHTKILSTRIHRSAEKAAVIPSIRRTHELWYQSFLLPFTFHIHLFSIYIVQNHTQWRELSKISFMILDPLDVAKFLFVILDPLDLARYCCRWFHHNDHQNTYDIIYQPIFA